ncbi:MAG: hypothetical protein FJ246_00615 [Nitrospira sp.]|nr:hypothetical protein [Nitrospira sp.]
MLLRTIALLGILLAGTSLGMFLLFAKGQAAESQSTAGGAAPLNPHSDLVFRVTGTKFCSDCHGSGAAKGAAPAVLDNEAVRSLKAKGKGAHGPGRFADCFRCHAGGRLGVEKY